MANEMGNEMNASSVEQSMTTHNDIKVGDRVRGAAGVFHPDHAAEGVVLNFLGGGKFVHVKLDNGEKGVVPTTTVHIGSSGDPSDSDPQGRA